MKYYTVKDIVSCSSNPPCRHWRLLRFVSLPRLPRPGYVYFSANLHTQIWSIQRHFQAQDPVDIAETELNSRSVATATFVKYANGDRVKLQQSSKAIGAQHFEEVCGRFYLLLLIFQFMY